MSDRWDSMPRMLGEQCDGHGGWSTEVYAIDLPSDVRLWVCKSCWYRLMDSDGWPEETDRRRRVETEFLGSPTPGTTTTQVKEQNMSDANSSGVAVTRRGDESPVIHPSGVGFTVDDHGNLTVLGANGAVAIHASGDWLQAQLG